MAHNAWNETFPQAASERIVETISRIYLSRIPDSFPGYALLCESVEKRNYKKLIDFEVDYTLPFSVFVFAQVRSLLALYQKRADVLYEPDVEVTTLLEGSAEPVSREIIPNRTWTAIGNFVAAEALCLESNVIFNLRARGEFSFPPRVEEVLHLSQRKVSLILGDVPSISDLKIRFGPGATTQVKKRSANPRAKLSERFACSELMSPHVHKYLGELEGWVFHHGDYPEESLQLPVDIHPGKLAFVPKNAKTDRGVVVEPSLNTMFQAGFGDYMTSRLRRFGIDLRDQSRNQRLAREGSITGALATLDLSNASDTISTGLVLDLLPIDWFLALDEIRTDQIVYKGTSIRLQKFSSMGNGFTFPLESLIFYALASACASIMGGGEVSVYGDDIIVPVSAYPLLVEVLRAVGFVPNVKKSFASGPFRESCGADYLSGTDIRPSYLKGPLSPRELFRLHNQCVRRDDSEVAAAFLSEIPEFFRIWGPDGYGDGHLIGDHHLSPLAREKGWCGHTFETYTLRPIRTFRVYDGDWVFPSYSTYTRGGGTFRKFPTLRAAALAYLREESSEPPLVYKDGLLGSTLPGSKGVNLIKVYKFPDTP